MATNSVQVNVGSKISKISEANTETSSRLMFTFVVFVVMALIGLGEWMLCLFIGFERLMDLLVRAVTMFFLIGFGAGISAIVIAGVLTPLWNRFSKNKVK